MRTVVINKAGCEYISYIDFDYYVDLNYILNLVNTFITITWRHQ